jgi:SAM-dependent methyltransferase
MGNWKARIDEKLPVTRKRHGDVARELWTVVQSLTNRVEWLEGALRDQRLTLGDRFPPGPAPGPDVCLTPIEPSYSMAGCVARLRELAPAACAEWERLLAVNATAYAGFPVDSCSVRGHPLAEKFRGFLRPYLTGAVLDIGCGPQPVPEYLAGHPTTRIAGLDPLPALHPFVFVQGTAEFVPWADRTFDTVVAATSLDHVLLLDRALREIRRVLRPDGTFVTWVSFQAGAATYDPYRPDVRPVDEFHLFHFDRLWFEAAVGVEFTPVEVFDLLGSTFVALRPKAE